MTVAVVPLRGRDGKTRLAGSLPPAARAGLVRVLARHVVGVLLGAPVVDRVLVVAADLASAADALGPLVDRVDLVRQGVHEPGLDAAVAAGRRAAGEARTLVLHADLPALTADDVAALVAPAEPVVLGPDAVGTGTNALVLAPSAARFATAFGPGSAGAHTARAYELGLGLAVVRRPGVGVDLDVPADWARLPERVRADLRLAVPGLDALDGPARAAAVSPASVPGGPPRPSGGAAG